MSDERLRLAFCALHPDRTAKLLAEWGSAGAVVRAIERCQVKAADQVREEARVPAAERRAQLTALGVSAVFRDAAGYPPGLAALPGAPDVLFVQGVLPVGPGVAVVGTRRCSAYGRGLARRFGEGIAAAGWSLVSGLARGIDAEAHHGTVAGGGIGVAVLGSGPDVWYPPENERLGRELVESGGAVITEYPPGTVPEPWRFPPRNRIISGLAAAVVVVEAGVKGGALITASMALEQGRHVFVVPGDVDRDSSAGCNLLIRDGAHPILGPDDLVEALSLIRELPPPNQPPSSDGEDELLAMLGPVGRTVEWIADRLGLPVEDTLARITQLEAHGTVTRHGALIRRVSPS